MAAADTLPAGHSIVLPVDSEGRITLPDSLRNSLHLEPGDKVVVSVQPDGTARLLSLREQLRAVQDDFASVAPGCSLADELIEERRQEAMAEMEE